MNHDFDHCTGECKTTIGTTICPCRENCHRYLATKELDKSKFLYYLNPFECMSHNFDAFWDEKSLHVKDYKPNF